MNSNNKSPYPDWVLAHKKQGTEIRLINSRYYLYEYKTVYDPTRKRAKKISGKLLGSITEKDGFIPSATRIASNSKGLQVNQPITVKEYGVVQLIEQRFSLYKDRMSLFFPEYWKEILAIVYCRFVFRCPLKNIPFRLDSSFLPESLQLPSFNEKTSSIILNQIGKMQASMKDYMKSFIKKGDYVLMDGTNIFSSSNQIDMVKQGFNHSYNFDGQVNLLYIYSATQRMPVYYRLLPGNIRDVKSFKNTLIEAGIEESVIIADKGFYSQSNIDLLTAEELSFIIPLKRDNSFINYQSIEDNTLKSGGNYFEFEKRIIWHQSFPIGKLMLHLVLDDVLRVQEEKDYLKRINNKSEGYTIEKYHERKNRFGTIAFLCNRVDDAKNAYETYKGRLYIETLFDSMKNVLEADHTYMQNEDTLQGWLFINHICLQWYQELYLELKDKQLLKRISVNDYISCLTDIKKIKINNQWYFNEFTTATKKLCNKLNIKI
jgi:transposase